MIYKKQSPPNAFLVHLWNEFPNELPFISQLKFVCFRCWNFFFFFFLQRWIWVYLRTYIHTPSILDSLNDSYEYEYINAYTFCVAIETECQSVKSANLSAWRMNIYEHEPFDTWFYVVQCANEKRPIHLMNV